jgi:hypothetical protein
MDDTMRNASLAVNSLRIGFLLYARRMKSCRPGRANHAR